LLTEAGIDIESRERDLSTMIESQFADLRHLPYRLYAVFIHHGSVEFGHYYIYIFDFKKEVWRKYNDNEVTEVRNTAEIFENQDRQNPPTPYFLVYVHEGKKDLLADPVCRQMAAVLGPLPEHPVGSMMDVITTVTTTEDVEMADPPAYQEGADGPAPGMEQNHSTDRSNSRSSKEPLDRAASGEWRPDDDAD
jgi:ubiquitin carboxyl-terminal hydrolase 25/28